MNEIVDVDAFYYQNNSKPQFERAQELLKSLELTKSSSVLDVGCGCGNIIAKISQQASEGTSIGIDASANMIQLAKSEFPNTQFPNLEFKELKAEEMDFNDNSFDVIICFSCLLWVREPKKAIDLMCRFLKPGGILLILTYLKESAYITFLERTLEDFTSYKALSAARTMLSIDEYRRILEVNCMKFEEFQPEWRFSRYKNTEELKAYLKGWLTCYVPLSSDLQETFLDKAVSESLKVSKSKDEIVLPFQQLAIRARKSIN